PIDPEAPEDPEVPDGPAGGRGGEVGQSDHGLLTSPVTASCDLYELCRSWIPTCGVFVWNFMSRRTIIESEIEMITEEVEDDSAIIYDKDARSKVRSFSKKEEAKRWSLQEEIAKTFEQPLKHGLFIWNDVPCSISPCYREYGDYTWFRLVIDANDMIERSRCFVSTPGFIHFTLSREWIARVLS
ncbi:hypothetical protein Tco_1571144, partial [Tanacetum coccineum]